MTDKGEIVVVGVCIDCLDNTWLGRRQMQFPMQPLFHKTLMPTGAGRKKKIKSLRDGFIVFGIAVVFTHKNQNHIAQTTTEEGICQSLLLIMELQNEKGWFIYQLNVGKQNLHSS